MLYAAYLLYSHLEQAELLLIRIAAGAYAGTKFAIEAFSEALRVELSNTRVRISCIEPELVKTELHDQWEVHPTVILNVPKPLQPEDVTRSCALS